LERIENQKSLARAALSAKGNAMKHTSGHLAGVRAISLARAWLAQTLTSITAP
jgi:hypothetical protein